MRSIYTIYRCSTSFHMCIECTWLFYEHLAHTGTERLLCLNPSCPLNLENFICPKAFVNISAGFSAPSTKYNFASLSSIHCQTKWYRISMCLNLFPWTGLDPKKMDPWLSPLIGTGPTFIPSSDKRVLIHLACLQQSHKAIYSASVDDKAMVFCARDCQEIEAPANWKK